MDEGADQSSANQPKGKAAVVWERVFGAVFFLGAIGAIGTIIAVELSSSGSRGFWEAALVGYPVGLVLVFLWNYLEASTYLELGIHSAVLLILVLLAYWGYTGYKENVRPKQENKASSAQSVPYARIPARSARMVSQIRLCSPHEQPKRG